MSTAVLTVAAECPIGRGPSGGKIGLMMDKRRDVVEWWPSRLLSAEFGLVIVKRFLREGATAR